MSMISRRTTEGTREVKSTMGRREFKRGVKRRGILPSFGDIVLPIVSVAAVCLLVLAGRQFFVNGLKTSPGITSTRAYADAPALIAEREQEVMPPIAQVAPVQETVAVQEVIAEPAENITPAKDVNIVVPKKPVSSTSTAQKKTSAPVSTTTQKKVAQAPAKTASLPLNKQWRVQIGAYGSKAAANETSNKLKKAGYKTEVYSNPASKYVKVWVYSGGDKASAEKVVAAMKKLGYKSSFAFPPAK